MAARARLRAESDGYLLAASERASGRFMDQSCARQARASEPTREPTREERANALADDQSARLDLARLGSAWLALSRPHAKLS